MGNFHSWMKHFGFFSLSLLHIPFLQKLVCFPNSWKNAQKLIIFWDYQTDFRFSSCKALNQIPTSSNNYIRILWLWWFSARSALKAVLILSLFRRKRGQTVKKINFFPQKRKIIRFESKHLFTAVPAEPQQNSIAVAISWLFIEANCGSRNLRQKNVTSLFFFTAPGGNNLNTLSMHLEGKKYY